MELRAEAGWWAASWASEFASPEAVESLRAIRRGPRHGEVLALSACDPLNLVGIFAPGNRIPATLANTVVYKDGVPTDHSGHPEQQQGSDPYPLPPRPSDDRVVGGGLRPQ